MSRNNEIKGLEQRFVLMRIHVQELNELQREQRQATQTMKQHHQQTPQTVTADDRTTRAGLIALQASQPTELSIEFSQQRSRLLARQRQEEVAQQKRIDQERGL